MSFIFNNSKSFIFWDIETFPNCFTASFLQDGKFTVFEISERKNERKLLLKFISESRKNSFVGFNSIGFDYPVLHFILKNDVGYTQIYEKAMSIINSDDRFSHMIWESDWLIPHIDVFKMMHFDNISKATSLKVLEFDMRRSIKPMPFDVVSLSHHEVDELIKYNKEDVLATEDFFMRVQEQFNMRVKLGKKYNKNFTNVSDVKIGTMILQDMMVKAGVKCTGSSPRSEIRLSDIILSYIRFDQCSFIELHRKLIETVIVGTKSVLKDYNTIVEGLKYSVGTGGLHASVKNKKFQSTKDFKIIDVDVASFYPNLAISNSWYPEHLGIGFCEAYLSIYETRKGFKKGTVENGAYKLALNGAYGNSNNKYSKFLYDPKFSMSITINGQLLLLVLINELLKVPHLKIIQANTDGVTYLCPTDYIEHTKSVCAWWEKLTGLTLESANYYKIFVKDVNSYIAVFDNGKVKRIGAYGHVTAEQDHGTRELPWHANWSARVIALVAEEHILTGCNIIDALKSNNDVYSFMLRTKIPKNTRLYVRDEELPKVVCYYVSVYGNQMCKIAPPVGVEGEYKKSNKCSKELYLENDNSVWNEEIHTKNRSVHEYRVTNIHSGFNVTVWDCDDKEPTDVNYQWYADQVEKLVGFEDGN